MAEEGEDFLIADAALLASVLARPRATAFGEPALPHTAVAGGGADAFAGSQPRLVDGNKCKARAEAELLLLFNGTALHAPSAADGERFVLDVSAGILTVPAIAQRLATWSTPA